MTDPYSRSLTPSSKLDVKPSRARKKLLAARERKANTLRRRLYSREDLSRLLERKVDVSENRLATAETIAQYLNDLAAAIKNADYIDSEGLFTLICERVFRYFLSDFQCIRAITMRIVRLACRNTKNLVMMLNNHIDMFLARSLDLDVENLDERVEALKLASHMLRIYSHANSAIRAETAERGELGGDCLEGGGPFLFPHSLILPILAIARTVFVTDAEDEKTTVKPDGLAFPSLAIFIELAISEPDLIIDTAGTGWVVDALSGPLVSNSRLSALICRVLYLWLDSPRLRTKAKMNMVIEQIFAPLIEVGFFQNSTHIKEMKPMAPHTQIVDVLDAFTRSFANVLCSWSGLLAVAATDESAKTVVSSQLRLLEFLGLGAVKNDNLRKIRGMIIDACCEYLDRRYAPKSFDKWIEAVHFYSKMHYADSFKSSLRDDFVLSEHEVNIASMEHFTEHVDLLASFRAVAIFFLIDAGFAQSLARFILIDPDDSISVKATLVLNDLLLMGSSFLPVEWRARVLCMPTLIQSACEALTRIVGPKVEHSNDKTENTHTDFTFINAGNAPVLLHRLDVLNKLALSTATQPLPIGNLELFVQSVPDVEPRARTFSASKADLRETDSGIDGRIHEMIVKVIDMNGEWRWSVVDGVLQLLQQDGMASLFRHRHSDRCFMFFSQLVQYLTPSAGALLNNSVDDRFCIACGCRAFRIVMHLCAVESRYEQLLLQFLTDYQSNLQPSELSAGVFSPKNVLNTASMYYLAFVGAISSSQCGRQMMESSQLLQTFIDLLTNTTSVEHVKLIVSCLDYSADGLTRVALQTALTSTNEAGRKWATRFLGVLASHEMHGFASWGMHLLLAQLADPSPKVVRHAVRILHRWLPFYSDALVLLRNVRLDALGDAGIMLKTHIFADEQYVKLHPHEVNASIDLWRKEFNARYADVIDEDMKVALLNFKRSLDGRFARLSNDRSSRQHVPMPIHLYGQLASHASGQQALSMSGETENLLNCLRQWPVSVEINQLRNVKGAIYALAHIAASPNLGVLNVPPETVPIVCRYAEQCPVLSVRGVAFWAMNLIGSSKQGARMLALLGWESNRHTEVIAQVANDGGSLCFVDENNIWIRCIDGYKNDQESYEKQRPQETVPNRPSRSNSASRVGSLSALSYVTSNTQQVMGSPPVRAGRTFTVDSVIHSGFGSAPKDDTDLQTPSNVDEDEDSRRVTRRRVTGPSEMADICVFGTSIDFQKCGEAHSSAVARSKYKLEPFAFSKMQVIQRSLGEPIRYIYMSNNELRAYREFRHVFVHLGTQHELSTARPCTRTVHSGWTVIALPGQADLLCKDIFAKATKQTRDLDVRSLLKERKRESPLGIFEGKPHNPLNCFYCTWREELSCPKVDVGQKTMSQESRSKILSMVQLMESKHVFSEKRLIKMYAAYRELFSSPCLYADVFEILSQYRYRLQTRRFLQELFVDVFYSFADNVMC